MIWTLPITVLVPVLFFAMLLAHEGGIFLQRRSNSQVGGDNSSNDEGFILSGVLGLLALLMAFSFSMALDRFENRRDLMMAEAGAIKSLAMIAETVGDPGRTEVQASLARYAKVRLAVVKLSDGDKRVSANQTATQYRRVLGNSVRASIRAELGESNAVALATAFDDVENSAVNREVVAAAHLPERVVTLLAAYTIIAAAMLGYAVTASGNRQRAASSTLYFLLALAFGVMLDLDRPRSGAIVISQEPFEEAVLSLRQFEQKSRPARYGLSARSTERQN